ncbi:MAG: F0F1 ATP synthase subunit epsilon [Corynebacteriales bacterium]|nr:F0F1 ATP synthase subunit epsilon [Mycobacteriales bacterium]
MEVAIVAVDQKVWSGQANAVFTATTEGELGILPGHAPLLGQLQENAPVRLETEDGELKFSTEGGYLSVTEEGVSILVESAEQING